MLILHLFIYICTIKLTQMSVEMFGLKADEIFESELGDVEEVRKQLQERTRLKISLKELHDKEEIKKFRAELERRRTKQMKTTTSTERVLVTPHIVEAQFNISQSELEIRRQKWNLIQMIKTERSGVPNFEEDLTLITRRFDGISSEKHNLKPARRELYTYIDDIPRIQKKKNRLLNLMAHFIYTSRYKLPFVQLMRLKYKHDVKYKIGFCFALLRQLRIEQKLLYSNIKNNYSYWNRIYIFMKFYERVVKLNQDIHDLVTFMKYLNYEMLKKYNPSYYFDSAESTPMINLSMYAPRTTAIIRPVPIIG